jgi:hypothetical protein
MVNRSTCFEEAIGRASGVKVTVEKGGALQDGRLRV